MIDQQFDFDDIDYSPKKKAVKNNKKSNYDDDFFDFDDKPQYKLPTINNRNVSAKSIESSIKSSTKRYNPYAQKLKNNSNNYYDDFEDDAQQNLPKTNKQTSTIPNKLQVNVNNTEDFYDFEQQVKKQPKIINSMPTRQEKVEEDADDIYDDEDFEEDIYGDDFEEVETKPVQITPIKKMQPIKKTTMTPPRKHSKGPKENNPPLPPKTTIKKQTRPHQSVSKPVIPRANSRKSIRSIDSMKNKSIASRSIKGLTNNSLYIPNKYKSMITKQFPELNTQKQSSDVLNRVNDRMRTMIKKLNDELNDMINKNLVQLKNNRHGKMVTVQDRIRILQEQRKNNDAAIERMQYQLNKLQGRQGEIKQQQYEIITDKKIQDTKQQIKKYQKDIHQLQVDINTDGNKLTKKNIEKRIAQELQHLKASLIQAKKDDEKGIEKVYKIQQKQRQLQGKVQDIQYQLKQKIQEAKSKGISLENREYLLRRYEETKRRVQITKNYKQKMENLMKTKADIIIHEMQQLRISINNTSSQIKNFYGSINHIHTESVKLIQKARDNPHVSSTVLNNLQELQKSLENAVQNDNYQFQMRSLSSRGGQNQKSRSLRKNTETGTGIKNTKNTAEIDEINMQKPNFMKKRNKNDDIEEKKNQLYERVWKEQEEEDKNEKKQTIIQENSVQHKLQDKDKKQQDKKKPFSLKRNRNRQQKEKEKETEEKPKEQLTLQLEDKKPQQQIKQTQQKTVAPKMFKFRRNRQTDEINKDKSQDNTTTGKQSNKQIKLPNKQQQIQEQPSKEQVKPIFAPKRFNLRNRIAEKKEDSYIPSSQPKKQEVKEDVKLGQDNNQKKKFDFNINQETTNHLTIGQDKKEDTTKPAFNLKLRDRRKMNQNNNDNDTYMPTVQKKIQEEPTANNNAYVPMRMRGRPPAQQSQQNNNSYNPLNNKKPQINNPNQSLNEEKPNSIQENLANPYAPKQNQKPQQEVNNPYNPYANQQNSHKRQREGPIRKNKLLSGKNKPKFNIYEQAEDLTQINSPEKPLQQPIKEAVYQSPPKIQKQQQKFDINAMLGIDNKKKNNNDFDDLLGNSPKIDRKKQKKRGQDFFGGLDDF